MPLLLLSALVLATPGPQVRPCPPGAAVARDAQSFQRLTAPGGPLDVWVGGLVKGDHEVRRPVRLHGCEGGVLEGSGRGTVLKVQADGALVEDLTLRRSGSRVTGEDGALKVAGKAVVVRRVRVEDALYGIALELCRDCILEDSVVHGRPSLEANLRGDGIKLWEAHGSTVRRNRVQGVRDCVVWYSRHVTLEDNTITHGRYGTHFMYAHDSVVRRSVLRDNVVGIFVMYSARVLAQDNVLAGSRGPAGMGIGFKESDAVTLERNRIVANSAGVYLDFTPRNPDLPVRFEGNTFALNGVAMRAHGAERGVSFLRNDFIANGVLVEVDGNADARGVHFEGNHWSPYAG
ncbi:MAG TPA: NosD domain-containing protein, partial [Aggregicoccus sp.]|nr:NosD domain-containing protein [Aggregicoccus sp.]